MKRENINNFINKIKKISLTSGAWATVNGVDLLTALK